MLVVLAPLAGALTASHNKGVIHRDLKPSNVFLADRVVLLDFGIAKLMEDTGTRITSSRHVVGTPPSMAPEQIVAGDIDERTDVYALGALVFFMLTARMPFVHSSIAQLLDLQLRAPAPPANRFAPVSPRLDAAIARALAKAPDDRQASVAKLFEEIQTAIEVEADAETPPILPGARATGVHVELRTPPGVAEWDDDELDAMELALPAVDSLFTKMSFRQVAQSGNSQLFLHPECTVEDAMKAAESAIAPFSSAAFSFHVHVSSGPLKTLSTVSSWVPSTSEPGVHIV